MKWLFYIAVILNIAYFAYNLSYKDSLIIPESSLTQSSDKSIVLLEELNNNDSNFDQAIQSGQKKNIESTEVSQNNNTTIDQELDETEEIEQKSVLTAQQNTAYITSIEILDKSVSTDLQEQEPEKQGSKPQESSELSVEPKKAQQVKQATAVNAAQNQNHARENDQQTITNCFMLGPFKKQELDIIKLELEQLYANRISFGIETTSKITYYRIYIPPLKSRELRKEALSRLDQNGMTDHYVMSIDGRKNAIALGVFKKREAAEKVAARANKLGFSTTIEAISDDKNSLYNLQLELQSDEPLDPLNNLIEKKQLKLTQCRK